MNYIQADIKKKIRIGGAFHPDFTDSPATLYAYITQPILIHDAPKEYALLAINPCHKKAFLGEIDSRTKIFNYFSKAEFATYEKTGKEIIRIMIPETQVKRIKTLDEILAISGIGTTAEFRGWKNF